MSDITITTSTVVADTNAAIDYGFAGAAITAGMPLYIDAANNNVLKPAGNLSIDEAAVVGIALHAAAIGQPIAYITAGDLTMTTSPALGVASVYVLGSGSGTGKISPTLDLDNSTGTRYGTVVGIGVTSTKLRVGLTASAVLNP